MKRCPHVHEELARPRRQGSLPPRLRDRFPRTGPGRLRDARGRPLRIRHRLGRHQGASRVLAHLPDAALWRDPDRWRVPVTLVAGNYSTTSETSIFPRVAFEYGHTTCAFSTIACSLSRGTPGALI